MFAAIGISACGLGSAVSTSGSLASNGSGASSAALPGSRGGTDIGKLCGDSAIQGRIIPDVEGEGDCGVRGAVLVQSVSGIALSPQPTVTCDTAKALNSWVSDTVKPVMSRAGSDVQVIDIAAHYVCRGVNRESDAELSEHAFGQAIDVSGFGLEDGRRVSVSTDWSSADYGPALRQMHAEACGPFRTTLGPGSDGFHEEHLHYDVSRRDSGTYCR